ncbi:hypothetical protein [Methanoplanus limicola]|uniref:Uncharacterized protein n=1 Tax=Methanoplanus limicola DSM 2279 TaxID=937775 RepID=H1Z0I3_9EURY|nr:hypothetical protein [Methanoplanus limicola]EHQ34450.1 hypothetical protein Metlim_0309 [Methanoplanus limicola DSM 2279]
MELKFDREKNRQERLKSVREYAEWVRSVPNEVWSSQQAVIINSFMQNAANYALTPEKYLEMKSKSSAEREEKIRQLSKKKLVLNRK